MLDSAMRKTTKSLQWFLTRSIRGRGPYMSHGLSSVTISQSGSTLLMSWSGNTEGSLQSMHLQLTCKGPRQAGIVTTGVLQETSPVLISACLVSHSGSANSSYPAEERQNVFFTESGILMNQHQC